MPEAVVNSYAMLDFPFVLQCTDGSIVVQSAAVVTAAAAVQTPLDLTGGQQRAVQQLQEKQQKQQGQSAGGRSAAQPDAGNVLPGEPDPASQAMIEWLVQHGAEVRGQLPHGACHGLLSYYQMVYQHHEGVLCIWLLLRVPVPWARSNEAAVAPAQQPSRMFRSLWLA